MPTLLHILSKPPDLLVQEIILRQTQQPGNEVDVVDLTLPDADYVALLEKIFAADSVEVW